MGVIPQYPPGYNLIIRQYHCPCHPLPRHNTFVEKRKVMADNIIVRRGIKLYLVIL